LYSPATLL